MDIRRHTISRILGKPAEDFTLEDIMSFMTDNGIEMLNFMYPAEDGRLKTLNFVIDSEEYLHSVLTNGERVDGSSLFSFIEAGNSDLYVVPKLRTAFIDPFEELPTICFLCAFFDKDGKRLEYSPEYTLYKAKTLFREKTGMDLIKYGHSEVGNFRSGGRIWEQNEIEFLPSDMEKAAEGLMLAKWIIRNLAYRYGLDVCFAPKIAAGKAGSGLHIHMRLMKDGRNMMLNDKGEISDVARKAIAGLMDMAYLRLVPHQEAPTNICWGDRNRSVLVRIPLGWTSGRDMFSEVNPPLADGMPEGTFLHRGHEMNSDPSVKQTMEIRSADCSADIYQLISALSIACRHGLGMDNALEVAERTYVDTDIHKDTRLADTLAHLPASCAESADTLEQQRSIYEADGIFHPAMIDSIISRLRSYSDADLRQRMKENPELEGELVRRFYRV